METNNSEVENNNEKITVADRFLIAMFSPKEYGKILKEKTNKVVWFTILLIFLCTMIRYVIPTVALIAGMGGMKDIIINEVPEFSLENGEFTLEKRIEKDDELSGVYVLIDTDVKKFTNDDVPKGVVEAVLISKTNMLVYNEYTGFTGETQEALFSEWKDITITNKTIIDNVGFVYFGIVTMLIVMYFFELSKYLMMGLFYSLFMLVYVKMFMLPTSFGQVFKTSVYAQAIGTLVYAITCCIGNATLMFAGNVFEILITFSIMRKVIFPIKRIPDSV
ncbi:MAG: DUF1189 family protein [Lachnospiraceae bacterium]